MGRTASDFLALFSRLTRQRFGYPYHPSNRARDLSFLKRLRETYGDIALKLMIGKFIEDVGPGINPNIVNLNAAAPLLATQIKKPQMEPNPHYDMLRNSSESS